MITQALKGDKVIEWLKQTDGYSILDPKFFREMGFPEDRLKRLTSSFSSDPELGKHAAIRKDGGTGNVEGVSEFNAVDSLARLLGVEPCHTWMGRGKNFRETVARCLTALGEEN